MPTRKQRRRQQKLRRHEWEEVWVDAEGRELEPEEVPVEETPAKVRDRARTNGKPRAQRQPAQRSGRVVQPPSWRRVLKRAGIFAPIMFVVVYLLNRGRAGHET